MNVELGTCGLCGDALGRGDTITVCPACNVMYHYECWCRNHGCAEPGCGVSDKQTARRERARRPDDSGRSNGNGILADYNRALAEADWQEFLVSHSARRAVLVSRHRSPPRFTVSPNGNLLLFDPDIFQCDCLLLPWFDISKNEMTDIETCFDNDAQDDEPLGRRRIVSVREPAVCMYDGGFWELKRKGRLRVADARAARRPSAEDEAVAPEDMYNGALVTGDFSSFNYRYHPTTVSVESLKTGPLTLTRDRSGRLLLVQDNGRSLLFPSPAIRFEDIPEVQTCFWIDGSMESSSTSGPFLFRLQEPASCGESKAGWVMTRLGRLVVVAR